MKYLRTNWEIGWQWQVSGHIFKDARERFFLNLRYLPHIYHGMCFSAAPVRENSTEARLPLGEQTYSDSLRGKKPESS
jgi:hypothetical protein